MDPCYFIAVEIEWKSLPPPPPDPVAETAQAIWTRGPQLLGRLNLEITLTKRLAPVLPPSLMRQNTVINEHGLSDDAFQAKSFKATIEKGNFTEPSWAGSGSSNRPRYALRLLFDRSPYPLREEWKKPEGGPDSNLFWENREFVGRCSPELEGKGTAMNDVAPAGWGSCVVS